MECKIFEQIVFAMKVNSKIFFIQKLVFEYFTHTCKFGEKVI